MRLVVDRVGSRPGRSGGFYERLRAGGVDVRVVRAPGRIDHRKQFVVDGRVGWVGGAGIEDHFNDGRFHDLFVRVTGPVVSQLQLVFLASFRWLDGTVAPEQLDALFPEHEPGAIPATVLHNAPGSYRPISTAIAELLDGARETLDVVNPYVADKAMIRRIAGAARRGRARPPVRAREAPTTAHAQPRSATTTPSCWTPACASSATRRCCTRRRSSATARRCWPAPATSRRGASSASSRSTCACARATSRRSFDERFSAPAEAISTPGERVGRDRAAARVRGVRGDLAAAVKLRGRMPDRERLRRTLTFWLRPRFVLRVVNRFQKVAGLRSRDRAGLERAHGDHPAGDRHELDRVAARRQGAPPTASSIATTSPAAAPRPSGTSSRRRRETDTSIGIIGFFLLLIAVLSFTRAVQRMFEQTWELKPLSVRNSANGLLWIVGLVLYLSVSGVVRGAAGQERSRPDRDDPRCSPRRPPSSIGAAACSAPAGSPARS